MKFSYEFDQNFKKFGDVISSDSRVYNAKDAVHPLSLTQTQGSSNVRSRDPDLVQPNRIPTSTSTGGGGDGRRPWRRRGRRLPAEGLEHDGRAQLPARALAPQHRHRHARRLPRLHPHRHEIRRARGTYPTPSPPLPFADARNPPDPCRR
jgi:hypothetical protein